MSNSFTSVLICPNHTRTFTPDDKLRKGIAERSQVAWIWLRVDIQTLFL